jgi:hypothetical protein
LCALIGGHRIVYVIVCYLVCFFCLRIHGLVEFFYLDLFVNAKLIHEGTWLNLRAGLHAVAVLAPPPPQHQFWVKPCTGRAYERAQRQSRQCRKLRGRQSRVQAGVAAETGDVAESFVAFAIFTTFLEACMLFVAPLTAIVCFFNVLVSILFNVLVSIRLPLSTVEISALLGGADAGVEALTDDGDQAHLHRRFFLGSCSSKCLGKFVALFEFHV